MHWYWQLNSFPPSYSMSSLVTIKTSINTIQSTWSLQKKLLILTYLLNLTLLYRYNGGDDVAYNSMQVCQWNQMKVMNSQIRIIHTHLLLICPMEKVWAIQLFLIAFLFLSMQNIAAKEMLWSVLPLLLWQLELGEIKQQWKTTTNTWLSFFDSF